MKLTSPEFNHNQSIPKRFSCDGDNVSPELHIHDVPDEAESLVLIVDDHDVPAQVKWDCYFDHWVVFNIPADTNKIGEGESVGTVGANSQGNSSYTGPCPPTKYHPIQHHYNFRLLALNSQQGLQEGATKEEFLAAAKGSVVSECILTGLFDRTK